MTTFLNAVIILMATKTLKQSVRSLVSHSQIFLHTGVTLQPINVLCSNMANSANRWPYYLDRSCCARPLTAAAANRYAVWWQGTAEVGRTDLQISTMTIFIDLAKSGKTDRTHSQLRIYGSSTGL